MKKNLKTIILTTLLMMSSIVFSQNTKTLNDLDKQATNIVDKTSNGLNKAYDDGTQAVSVLYGDLKLLAPKVENAIKQLAKGLKIGAESVWEILVKQQKVWSWCYLLGFIFAFISWIHFYYRFSLGTKNKNDEGWLQEDVIITLLTLVVSSGLSILCIQNLESMMTGFINPEFGAMRNIIQLASQLK